MTIKQFTEETIIKIFKCSVCGNCYYENPAKMNLSCCVIHSPGSCCHYSDLAISEGNIKQIKRFLEEANG